MKCEIPFIVASLVVFALAMQERNAFSAHPSSAAVNVKQIIAHRGARAERPENTLATTRRATEA
jgi:glycerophosphoryl diester phosphodiesterase